MREFHKEGEELLVLHEVFLATYFRVPSFQPEAWAGRPSARAGSSKRTLETKSGSLKERSRAVVKDLRPFW